MNNTKGAIAIIDGIDDDPKGHDVGQLLESDMLSLGLCPDRIRRFFPTVNLGSNFSLRECRFESFNNLFNRIATLLS